MAVKRISIPPAIADVIDDKGRLSKSWLDFLHAMREYINQASATTATIAVYTDTPANVGEAATLVDLNALRTAVNAINTKLGVS